MDNTIQDTFRIQNEKAERERALAAAAGATGGCDASGGSTDPSITKVVSQIHHPATAKPSPKDNNNCSVAAIPPSAPVHPAASSSQGASSDAYNNRILDTINRVANNQVDTDSDTLSASSPPPQIKRSDTNSPLNKSGSGTSSSGSSHPHHMKKFWLQRHDEDKKSETSVFSNPTENEDSNSSLSQAKDMISCIENSSSSLAEQGRNSITSSPANVVVTLPNGNISDLNHHNDESTSSASEAETQVSSLLVAVYR